MHRPQLLPHLKVVEHEHQLLVLFPPLPSPHRWREERYVIWWPFDRLFQWPPPEKRCRPLPVAHIGSFGANDILPRCYRSCTTPLCALRSGTNMRFKRPTQTCCDRNSCRNSSYTRLVFFLISSINSWRILLVNYALVYKVGEEYEYRSAAMK